MRIKIIHCHESSMPAVLENLEQKVNAWLESKPNLNIYDIRISDSVKSTSLFAVIIYRLPS